MLMRLLTRTMKETDDDESDGNRNELMTTMMRTKWMMRIYDEDDEDDGIGC